jgi:hypothetical protein
MDGRLGGGSATASVAGRKVGTGVRAGVGLGPELAPGWELELGLGLELRLELGLVGGGEMVNGCGWGGVGSKGGQAPRTPNRVWGLGEPSTPWSGA